MMQTNVMQLLFHHKNTRFMALGVLSVMCDDVNIRSNTFTDIFLFSCLFEPAVRSETE